METVEMSDRSDPRKDIPWLRGLNSMLAENEVLDSLRDAVHFVPLQSVAVLSDYDGEHSGSRFSTYSFLFTAMGALRAWHERILMLKSRHFPDRRTMEYKQLGDALRQRALPEWLALSGLMPGCLVSIAVEKKIDYLFLPEGGNIRQVLEEAGFVGYSLPVARKLIQIVHFLCYLSSCIYGPKNRLFWYTDRDSISGSGNRALMTQLGSIVSRIVPLYFTERPESMGFSDGLNDPDRMFEDGLSLPDLTAGALADKFTPNREQLAHKKGREAIPLWIADKTKNLRHLTIRFDSHTPARDGTPRFVPKIVTLNSRGKRRDSGSSSDL